MLRDAAITIIKRGLGFKTGTSLDTMLIDALVQAQAKREGGGSLPWFLLQEDQTEAVVADTAAYALPTSFLREDIDHNPVTLTDADGNVVVLDPIAFDEATRLYATDAVGIPEVYCRRQDTFVLFPTPEEDYTFTWSYYKAADALTSNIENAWLLHVPYVLISDAGLRAALDLRDVEAAAIYKSEKAEWDDWYLRKMSENSEANIRYVVGKYA